MSPDLEFTFGQPMTIEQWADMPEDEEGELVDGRLAEEEMPSALHEVVVVWLIRVLGQWTEPRGGFLLASEAKFAISRRRGRKPDLSLYMPGRRPPAQGVIGIPPDLMVEVVSPRPRDGRRDRVAKVDDYAAFGVRYYWIVDPQLRSLEILERAADGRYVHVLGAGDDPVEAVPGFPGLRLPLDALWAEVDRLSPPTESSQ